MDDLDELSRGAELGFALAADLVKAQDQTGIPMPPLAYAVWYRAMSAIKARELFEGATEPHWRELCWEMREQAYEDLEEAAVIWAQEARDECG